MSISLYSAASGMEGQQTNLNVISNNIANVNTTGFKKNKVEFQDMFYQIPKSVGTEAGGNLIPTGIQVGSGTQVVSTSKIFTQGQVNQTGEQLDLAIVGEGFFRVQDQNGNTLYTRDGALKRGPNGTLMTSQGMSLADNITIPPNSVSVVVNEAGQVMGVDSDGNNAIVGTIQFAKFNNPSGLKAMGNNLFQQTDASGNETILQAGSEGVGTLQQGYLETSNVNIVQEMVNMILAQRAYEINSKSIQTSDQMMQQVSSLKR